MKRIVPNLLLLATVLGCVAFAGYEYRDHMTKDVTAPDIYMDQDWIEVSVLDADEQLLNGVTARDQRDGDVTGSLVVEGISSIREDHTATVTYAAVDSACNVAKAQRTVIYTDYQSPVFSLRKPLMFAVGQTVDVFSSIHAKDIIDGSLDNRIKATLVSGETTLSEQGVHDVSFRVTNSMGDTVSLVLPVEVYDAGAYNAELTLSTYLIYLQQGERFSARRYLSSFRAEYEDISLENGVPSGMTLKLDNQVDTSQPGVYTVTYIVSNGDYKAISRLIVVVEDQDAAQ